MKLVTWNVNSRKVRMRRVLDVFETPDVDAYEPAAFAGSTHVRPVITELG